LAPRDRTRCRGGRHRCDRARCCCFLDPLRPALLRSGASAELYDDYRANLGRAILLGLEFLVAADIIGTVAVDPTLENLGVLAVIVAIRTFLSFALEVEIQGRWPWQQHLSDRPSGTRPGGTEP
jgi:hypothetical protein